MEVTARDVARIPRTNIHVPREEFAAVWRAAEHRNTEQGARGVTDWYAGGVVVTCRWLATATVRPSAGPWYSERSPVTERSVQAHEELIAAECIEAERLAMRRPVPDWLAGRPGWIEGIIATLQWAWVRRAGPNDEVVFGPPVAA